MERERRTESRRSRDAPEFAIHPADEIPSAETSFIAVSLGRTKFCGITPRATPSRPSSSLLSSVVSSDNDDASSRYPRYVDARDYARPSFSDPVDVLRKSREQSSFLSKRRRSVLTRAESIEENRTSREKRFLAVNFSSRDRSSKRSRKFGTRDRLYLIASESRTGPRNQKRSFPSFVIAFGIASRAFSRHSELPVDRSRTTSVDDNARIIA